MSAIHKSKYPTDISYNKVWEVSLERLGNFFWWVWWIGLW